MLCQAVLGYASSSLVSLSTNGVLRAAAVSTLSKGLQHMRWYSRQHPASGRALSNPVNPSLPAANVVGLGASNASAPLGQSLAGSLQHMRWYTRDWTAGRVPNYLQPIRPPANIGFAIVPQQQAFVVERFGRYNRVLQPGLHLLIPLIESVAYVHSLKELAVQVGHQQAITKDNVTISFDGIVYIRVVDAYKASYGVDNPFYSIIQLCQTTTRSELGKITLDKTFEERQALNLTVVHSINEAADAWGIQCTRYEIKDISPPPGVAKAMELQAEAERRKRAHILESEGLKQSKINVAEADKQQVILASEATKQQTVNMAVGEAEAILRRAQATAEGIRVVAEGLQSNGGSQAAALRVAEQYVSAFRAIAKHGNTLLLPAGINEPASMVAQAMSIYQTVAKQGEHAQHGSHASSSDLGDDDVTRQPSAATSHSSAAHQLDSQKLSGSSDAHSKGQHSSSNGFSLQRKE